VVLLREMGETKKIKIRRRRSMSPLHLPHALEESARRGGEQRPHLDSQLLHRTQNAS
jgi:hypothetical protein